MATTKSAGSSTGTKSAATKSASKSKSSSTSGAAAQSLKASGSATKSGPASNGRGSGSKTAKQSAGGQGQGNTQLEKYFHDALKDIYWAEKHLTKALPKMQKAATTEELRSAITDHIEQTKEHVARVEQVFEIFGKKAQAKKCEAMEGIVKEGESIVEETEDGSMTRDVGIIMAAQKVEHYEIATYGGLVSLARTLGLNEAVDILSQTLDEEKQTDAGLTDIAENNINWEAEQEDSDDSDADSDEETEEDESEE